MDKLIVDCTTGQIIERDYTEEEKQLIEEQRQNELLNPIIVPEPVDQEKVAMAEAIIAFEERITELENKLNGGM